MTDPIAAVTQLLTETRQARLDRDRLRDAWERLDVTDRMWLGQSDTYQKLAAAIVQQVNHE